MQTSVNTQLSIHSATATQAALCAAIDLPGGEVPEWIHLLPAGEIRTADGRGPYRYASGGELIASSLKPGDRLVLDVNHATDLSAPKGGAAPAAGWIVELQERSDGIWGRVDWTKAGRDLVADRAYRGISPAIAHDRSGSIQAILRASLVNVPNLVGLTALHNSETDMDFITRLRKALGLDDSASEDAIVTAATSLHQKGQEHATALQAQIAPIAKAAGLDEDVKPEAIVEAITALAAAKGDTDAGSEVITALQSELKTVTTELNTLKTASARTNAEAFVDGAIKAGRVGVKPLRDHYITRHMADPAAVEKEIDAFPMLGASGALEMPPPSAQDGVVSLNAAQKQVAAMLGIEEKAYAETLAAEAAQQEAL